jgi:hypothetical protein
VVPFVDTNRPSNRYGKTPKRKHNQEQALVLPDVIVTPPPDTTNDEPILLLEGDQYFAADASNSNANTGDIARTLYQMIPNNHLQGNTSCGNISSLAIEELYDIQRARKSFVVRETSLASFDDSSRGDDNRVSQNKKIIHLGKPIRKESLFLQEIPGPSLGSVSARNGSGPGTGSRTWESSIVMSMYFAAHPELLSGDCAEIGSGVGLGGILNFLFRKASSISSTKPFNSMTLTDYNEQVLRQCQENVERLCDEQASIRVAKIDWYDFVRGTGTSTAYAGKFDTVIACDCAYLYPDIVALCSAMKGLLKNEETSRIHVFGPSNRGGLHKLISELKGDNSIDATVEEIEMARYRLQPMETDSSVSVNALDAASQQAYRDEVCDFFRKNKAHFLHVTCSLRLNSPITCVEHGSISDID